MLADTLMLSTLALQSKVKEFAKRSKGTGTPRLYDLPQAASALAPLFAPSSIFSLLLARECPLAPQFSMLMLQPSASFCASSRIVHITSLASSHVPYDLGRGIKL